MRRLLRNSSPSVGALGIRGSPIRRRARQARLCDLPRVRVQKILNRRDLGRRRQRVAALALLTATTNGLVTDPALEGLFGFRQFAAIPGDLVALDGFFIGNVKGVGVVWQLKRHRG